MTRVPPAIGVLDHLPLPDSFSFFCPSSLAGPPPESLCQLSLLTFGPYESCGARRNKVVLPAGFLCFRVLFLELCVSLPCGSSRLVPPVFVLSLSPALGPPHFSFPQFFFFFGFFRTAAPVNCGNLFLPHFPNLSPFSHPSFFFFPGLFPSRVISPMKAAPGHRTDSNFVPFLLFGMTLVFAFFFSFFSLRDDRRF